MVDSNPHRFYFKRSIVDKVRGEEATFRKYTQNVYPITFSIKTEAQQFKDILKETRLTDISLFFGNKIHYYRDLVSEKVYTYFKDNYCVRQGIIGQDGVPGRNSI